MEQDSNEMAYFIHIEKLHICPLKQVWEMNPIPDCHLEDTMYPWQSVQNNNNVQSG